MSGNFIGAQPYIQFGLELAKALNWIRHDVLDDVLELARFLESQHQVS